MTNPNAVNSALAAIALATLWGSGGQAATYSSPGTFYVQFLEPVADKPFSHVVTETTVLQSGRAVGHDESLNLIVPRDRPDRALRIDVKNLTAQTISDGKKHHIDACQDPLNDTAIYALSPDGLTGLCSSISNSALYLFDPLGRHPKRLVDKNFFLNATGTSFAWLDNDTFIATRLDHPACPYMTIYEDGPTRLITYSRTGRIISRGPCAVGVVAGRKRVAYISEAPNSTSWKIRQFLADDPRFYNDGYDRAHHVWSVDEGQTWHSGVPYVFDGNDRLLYEDVEASVIRSEDGALAFRAARKIQWSK